MNDGPRAGCIFAVYQSNFAPVRSRDLLSKSKADSASLRLGGVEGHEQIFGIRDAHAAVFDSDHEVGIRNTPADAHGLGAVRQRGIDGIGKQIDKHLLELIWVRVQHDGWAEVHLNRYTLLEQCDSLEKLPCLNLL